MDAERLWMGTLNLMKQEVSKPSFDTWLAKARFLKKENNTLYVDTENEFQRDWLEGRYSKRVNEIIKELSNNDKLAVSYVYTSNRDPYQETISSEHYNDREGLLLRVEMLEKKVLNLESEIAEIKRKN